MAYQKTEWKNREVESPRTYTIQENSDGTVTLIPAEGQVIEPGTPIIAQTMNNIEDGIKDLDTVVGEHLAEFVQQLQNSGYQKLPNGLIYQWKTIPGGFTTNSAGSFGTPLPITFPNEVYVVFATSNMLNYTSTERVTGATFASKSLVSVFTNNEGAKIYPHDVMILAIGR